MVDRRADRAITARTRCRCLCVSGREPSLEPELTGLVPPAAFVGGESTVDAIHALVGECGSVGLLGGTCL
jgi:hypothetical protein